MAVRKKTSANVMVGGFNRGEDEGRLEPISFHLHGKMAVLDVCTLSYSNVHQLFGFGRKP